MRFPTFPQLPLGAGVRAREERVPKGKKPPRLRSLLAGLFLEDLKTLHFREVPG
jgi:hypothetical protein